LPVEKSASQTRVPILSNRVLLSRRYLRLRLLYPDFLRSFPSQCECEIFLDLCSEEPAGRSRHIPDRRPQNISRNGGRLPRALGLGKQRARSGEHELRAKG